MTAPSTEGPGYDRRLIAIDLGKWVSGLAHFYRGRLVEAYEVRIRRGSFPALRMGQALLSAGLRHCDEDGALWVSERMRDYPGKGARTENLEELRRVWEWLIEHFRKTPHDFRNIPAAEWKGNVPKAVTRTRIRDILFRAERVAVRPKTKETYDAVGLGLVVMGRAKRGLEPANPPPAHSR